MGHYKESVLILVLLFKTAELQLVYCGCIVVFRGTHTQYYSNAYNLIKLYRNAYFIVFDLVDLSNEPVTSLRP